MSDAPTPVALDPLKFQYDVGTPVQQVPFETLPPGKRCYFRFANEADRSQMVGMSRHWAEKRELRAIWLATWKGYNFVFGPTKILPRVNVETKPGRPPGPDFQTLAELDVDGDAEFYHTLRNVQQLRNLATRAGKTLNRKFSVKLVGDYYVVTRTR